MFSKGPAARTSLRLWLLLALGATILTPPRPCPRSIDHSAALARRRLLLCRRWLLGLGLALGGLLLMAAPGGAGVIDASWTAPTTNVDGSSLTDLASYRVYYGTSNPSCPGSSFF